MPARSIPDIVISRLPVYLQALQHRLRLGEGMTSSKELAEQIGDTEGKQERVCDPAFAGYSQ